eukprot:768786-Hanusia_phi.AAC.4
MGAQGLSCGDSVARRAECGWRNMSKREEGTRRKFGERWISRESCTQTLYCTPVVLETAEMHGIVNA